MGSADFSREDFHGFVPSGVIRRKNTRDFSWILAASQKDRGLKPRYPQIYSTTIGSDGAKMKIKPTTASGGRC